MPTDTATSFTTVCNEDEDGNLLFEFPDELLDLVGWTEGDTLEISAIGDGIRMRRVGGAAETGGPVLEQV
jgi:hypothetical protein